MGRGQRAKLFELADLVLAISRHVNAAKDAHAEAGTLVDAAVMRHVDRNPGTTAGAAAEATQLLPSNLSRAVRGLEARGLLRREPDPADARRVRLYPTAKAARNLETLHTVWGDLLAGAVPDAAELRATLATLRQVEAHLLAGPSA